MSAGLVADRAIAPVQQQPSLGGLQLAAGQRCDQELASALRASRVAKLVGQERVSLLSDVPGHFPGKIVCDMSTEKPPAASDSLMESQGAAAASGAHPSRWQRPVLAAVEPPAEAGSESLSFDDFYRREHRHVLGLAFVLTGNQWVAEDTAQDAFTAAFRQWRSIVAYDSPGAWVRRVTCNRAASVLRRRVREAKALVRLAGRTKPYIELDEGDDAFWQAVRRLPPRQAQAVALYYMEDYSVREIAEVLDCSEGTVKTHLSRARDAVARQLRLEDDQ
jgi:RNA polymerase sigma factor (sigma-70 family)